MDGYQTIRITRKGATTIDVGREFALHAGFGDHAYVAVSIDAPTLVYPKEKLAGMLDLQVHASEPAARIECLGDTFEIQVADEYFDRAAAALLKQKAA